MKQEALYRITSLIIAFILTLAVCSIVYFDKNTYKTIIDIADKIDGLEWQIEPCRYEGELLDRIDELTRENERLIMEVASQHAELKVYEGMAEK